MPNLKVSLELEASDLASPNIRKVIQQVERLQQATERLRQQQTGAGQTGMIRLSRDTQQAQQSMSTFQQVLQQAIGVAGGIELADVVSTIAQGLLQVGVAAINANAALQRMQATMRVFVRDPQMADAMLTMLRRNADVTPFGTEEVLAAGTQLVPIAQNVQDLQQAVRLAERLAVLNPDQGLQGAAFALREAEAGDYVSLQTRFNIQRSLINQLKGEGLSGIALTTEALDRMGVTWALVSEQGATFEGRLSTITSTLQELARVAAAPTFELLVERQQRAAQSLEENRPQLTRAAGAVGTGLAFILEGNLDAAEQDLGGFIGILDHLGAASQHTAGVLQLLWAAISPPGRPQTSLLDAILPAADRAALLGPLASAWPPLADLWQRLTEFDAAFLGRGRAAASTLLAANEQRAGERSAEDAAAIQRALAAANYLRMVRNVQATQRPGERGTGSVYASEQFRRQMDDQEDAITRHTGRWRDTANAIADAGMHVQIYTDRLKGLGTRAGILGGLLDPLLAYRSQALRTGTFTGGEAAQINAAILQIKTLQAANVKDTGLAALADFLARTYDQQVGGNFFGTEEMTVTASTVIVNGPPGGPSAAFAATHGTDYPDMITRRYANSRLGWPEGPGLGGVLHR